MVLMGELSSAAYFELSVLALSSRFDGPALFA